MELIPSRIYIYTPPWTLTQFQAIGKYFRESRALVSNSSAREIKARFHRFGPSWYAVFLKNEIEYNAIHFHQDLLISELLDENEENGEDVMQKLIDHPHQDFMLHWELPSDEDFQIGDMSNRVLHEYVQ